jgi:hypothetical protein
LLRAAWTAIDLTTNPPLPISDPLDISSEISGESLGRGGSRSTNGSTARIAAAGGPLNAIMLHF